MQDDDKLPDDEKFLSDDKFYLIQRYLDRHESALEIINACRQSEELRRMLTSPAACVHGLEHEDPKIRALALQAISLPWMPRRLGYLWAIKMTNDENEEVLMIALHLIGERFAPEDSHAVYLLARSLFYRHKSKLVRAWAYYVLTIIGGFSAGMGFLIHQGDEEYPYDIDAIESTLSRLEPHGSHLKVDWKTVLFGEYEWPRSIPE